MTAGTEPLLCRVAAAPYPAYRVLSQAYTSQTRQAPRRRESIDYLPGNPVAWLFCRVAAAPYPAYGVLYQAYTSQTRQAQRHRAMTAGTEPF
ncbi:TPA: hypothetical protein ACMEW0_005503, partial [Klebsiella quasipneumoniae subsp. quasipneumoniae]